MKIIMIRTVHMNRLMKGSKKKITIPLIMKRLMKNNCSIKFFMALLTRLR